jgi:hypothetical protein
MSKPNNATYYFEYVAEYCVAACRECSHAVWPDQIKGHLQEQHKISRKDSEAFREEIRRWAGIVMHEPNLFVTPRNPEPCIAITVRRSR